MYQEMNQEIPCSKVTQEISKAWKREQIELKQNLITHDVFDWQTLICNDDNLIRVPGLQYIGGVDLSFIKGNDVTACACLVVLNFPELEVVYKRCTIVELTAPYIPGFLAFREVSFLVSELDHLKREHPLLTPDVILVDGNGLLHPEEFGLACHLGVLVDIPCIGVGKTLFHVDGFEKYGDLKAKVHDLKAGGSFPLAGDSETVLGAALRSCSGSTNPIYVSVGHKICLKTAICVVKKCSLHRIPEPVRQADFQSREYLRIKFNLDGSQNTKKTKVRKPNKKSHSHYESHNSASEPPSIIDEEDFTFCDLWCDVK